MAEVLKQLAAFAPFGIGFLVVAALVVLYVVPPSATRLRTLTIVILAMLAVYFGEKYFSPKPPMPDPGPSPTKSAAVWVDTGLQADWGGNDRAFAKGLTPRYRVLTTELCGDNDLGLVATCWDNRLGGHEPNVPSDVDQSDREWCAYKNKTVKVTTPANGGAPPGRVYLCARPVPPM
jgi:hypothetical protein